MKLSFFRKLSGLPDWLTWFLSVLELLIVIAIAGLTGYAVFCFLTGSASETRFLHLIQTVNENWKAALVLLIPLFYRPVRIFLERLEQGPFGMKTKSVVVEKEEKANP